MLCNLISFQKAGKAIILVSLFVIFYHILVITGYVSFKYVWGSRLSGKDEMMRYEIIFIVLNLILITVVYYRMKIYSTFFNQLLNVILWVFAGLFIWNTVVNIISNSLAENIILTPVTLFIALLCLRLTFEKS